MSNPVNWFEVPVADMARAKRFYSKAVGYEVNDMPSPVPGMTMASFPMKQGAPYATGALVASDHHKPSGVGSTVFFSCGDLDGVLTRVPEFGGKVLLPRTSIGEFGFIAHALDSEGNKIGLHSEK